MTLDLVPVKKLDLRPVKKLDLRPVSKPEDDKSGLLNQIGRKATLFEKTIGDVVLYPFGGTENVLNKISSGLEKIGYQASPEEKKRLEYIKNIRPESPVEHIESAATQFYGIGKMVGPIAQVFGIGQPMSVGQTVLRNAGVGATIGALAPAETTEDRLRNTAVSGIIGGGLSAGLVGAQGALANIGRKNLQKIVETGTKYVDALETGLKTGSTTSNAKTFQSLLSELNPKERNYVLNVMKGRYGMSQREYRNVYQRNIGDPAYKQIIGWVEKYTPDLIKEKLVYRYNSPQFLTDLHDKYNQSLSNWNKKAIETGNLMTEGLSAAESTTIFRAIQQPTQMELLNTVRPDLAKRALEARTIIDSISQDYIGILKDKARITDSSVLKNQYLEMADTLKKNIGAYLQRTYSTYADKSGGMLSTRGTVSAKPIFERNKVAREIYTKELRNKINTFTREHNNLTPKSIGGVGDVVKSRLEKRGIKTVEDLASMKKQDLASVLLMEEKNRLDVRSAPAISAVEKIDNEINNLNKLISQQGILSDLGNQAKSRRSPFKALGDTAAGKRAELEGGYVARINKLVEARDKIMNNLKSSNSAKYIDAENRADEMINQAGRLASRRRGLTGKINEYENLIEKPLKQPDIPYEIKKKLGYIETGGFPVYKSIRDAGYRMEADRLFNSIALDGRYATTDKMALGRGWVEIPDSLTKGALRGMVVHPQVAKDILSMERILTDQNKALTKLVSLWKVGKTALNPATHGRNVISNIMLLEASGTPSHRIPDLLAQSVDDITNKSILYRELQKRGIGFSTFTEAELSFINDIYKHNQGGLINKILNKAVSKSESALKPFKSLEKLYGLEEQLFKIAKTRQLLEQGYNINNAFAEAEKWLFNYNRIPDFIRSVRNSPFGSPFITFQYKAIPRIFEALVKNPIDVIKYPIFFGALEQYAKQKFNLSDSDMKLLKRDQPLNYLLPFTDSNNQLRMYNLKYTLPYGQIFEENPLATFGIGNNPIFSVPSSVLWNRNPLTGREIFNANDSQFKQFSDKFDFTMKQILPTLTPFLGYSAETIGKAINGIPLTKYGEKPDYWLELLGNIGGVKTKPTSIPITYQRFISEIKRIESDSNRAKGAIIKDQSLTPKEQQAQLEDLMKETIKAMKERTDILQKTNPGALK